MKLLGLKTRHIKPLEPTSIAITLIAIDILINIDINMRLTSCL